MDRIKLEVTVTEDDDGVGTWGPRPHEIYLTRRDFNQETGRAEVKIRDKERDIKIAIILPEGT